MFQNKELEKQCESCKKLISKDDFTGLCSLCFKATCINCRKICDRCLKTFCGKHSTTKISWYAGNKIKLILCDMCKNVGKE